MKLRVISSGSIGNCYVLQGQQETLLIELGVKWDKILQGLNFNLRGVVAALASHLHLDHSKSIHDALSCGIKVYSCEGVADKFKGVTPLAPLKGYRIGGFKVFTLPVQHDVECYAYVVEHDEMGKLLFVTDAMMLEYRISGLNHIMVEANYADEIVDENIDKGYIPTVMRDRLMTTHFSIDNVVDMLKSNDLSAVNEIVLLHLSRLDADGERFRSQVARATGKPVYIAEKGLEIGIGKEIY